eukprot:354935-Chlamydomonas_euryale.AAC.5
MLPVGRQSLRAGLESEAAGRGRTHGSRDALARMAPRRARPRDWLLTRGDWGQVLEAWRGRPSCPQHLLPGLNCEPLGATGRPAACPPRSASPRPRSRPPRRCQDVEPCCPTECDDAMCRRSDQVLFVPDVPPAPTKPDEIHADMGCRAFHSECVLGRSALQLAATQWASSRSRN